MPFLIWGIWVWLKVVDFPSLWWDSIWSNCPSKEFNLSDTKMALLYCQFLSCVVNELEDCPSVPGKFRSIAGYNNDVVHVLKTLVSLDNWVQVLAHETWRGTHRSAKTLCESLVGKNSASKSKRKQFHWPLVRHLQTVIRLGAMELAVDRLLFRILDCIWQNAFWVFLDLDSLLQSSCYFSWKPQVGVVFR